MANYVNNKQFRKLLSEYKITKDKKIYNEIGKIFLLIATRHLNKTHFIGYTQDRKNEIISDAVYSMCRYIDKYDEKISTNAFSYFTEYAKNSTLLYLNNRKKYDEFFKSIDYIESIDSESVNLDD
jgi:hypothetical protein